MSSQIKLVLEDLVVGVENDQFVDLDDKNEKKRSQDVDDAIGEKNSAKKMKFAEERFDPDNTKEQVFQEPRKEKNRLDQSKDFRKHLFPFKSDFYSRSCVEYPRAKKDNEDDTSGIGIFLHQERDLFCKMAIDRTRVREAMLRAHQGNVADAESNTDDDTPEEACSPKAESDFDFEILSQAKPVLSQCGQVKLSDDYDYLDPLFRHSAPIMVDQAVQTSLPCACGRCVCRNVSA